MLSLPDFAVAGLDLDVAVRDFAVAGRDFFFWLALGGSPTLWNISFLSVGLLLANFFFRFYITTILFL